MTKKIQLLILFTNFVLASCAQNSDPNKLKTVAPQPSKSNNIIDYSSIKLIDKFDNKLVKDTSSKTTEAFFSPVYIGEKEAEVKLTYKTQKIGYRVKNWDKYNSPGPKSMIITIDTSKTIGSQMKMWEYYKLPEYRHEIMAFPVFIENISTDTLNIGFGETLPVIIEAKDKNGKWKPIQRHFIYDCGTGLTSFYLPPKTIAISPMKLFEGNFNTKLRLAFGFSDEIIYSNEIEGQINIGQFE